MGNTMAATPVSDTNNAMPTGGSNNAAWETTMPNTGSGTMDNGGGQNVTMPDGTMDMTENNSLQNAASLPTVAEFVSQIYFEGLPLDKAALYTEADADILITMLGDASQAQYHENIALTLGMIGSSKSVEPLLAYLKSGPTNNAPALGDDTTSRPVYRGRVGAIMALGYIANKTGDEKALNYLIESTTPSVWNTRIPEPSSRLSAD